MTVLQGKYHASHLYYLALCSYKEISETIHFQREKVDLTHSLEAQIQNHVAHWFGPLVMVAP